MRCLIQSTNTYFMQGNPFYMRRFVLRRLEDVHGCSGTGIVAQGVEFWNGKATLCWFPGPAGISTVTQFESVADVIALHGHEGRTVIEFLDNSNDNSDNQSGQRP